MSLMRAKFRVVEVLEYKGADGKASSEKLKMSAVGGNKVEHGYPQDGSDEDNTFARYTPNASLEMFIQNPALFGKFKTNDKLYVDFSLASDRQ